MPYAWFDIYDYNLKNLSVNDMIVRLGTVADLVSAHKGYQGNLPEEVAGPQRFRELAAQLQHAQLEAANKDTAKVAIVDQLHSESAVALKAFGHFTVIRAIKHNDISYIENLGFQQKKRMSANRVTTHGPVAAPSAVVVKHGPESGSVTFKVAKVQWAAHYDLELCTGDPTNEQCWSAAGTFVNTRNMRIDGLEPGKVYMFRIRCLGPTGFGPYSNIVKLMVI